MNILPNQQLSGAVFLAPWRRSWSRSKKYQGSRSKKIPGARAAWEKQEPEPFEEKSEAGAAKKLAGSPALNKVEKGQK